jgi:hypothetical protein
MDLDQWKHIKKSANLTIPFTMKRKQSFCVEDVYETDTPENVFYHLSKTVRAEIMEHQEENEDQKNTNKVRFMIPFQ